MDELKPCPFCGGEVQILGAREKSFREDRPCFIYCPKCQFETGIYANARITTRKWNHRAAPENKPLTYSIEFTQDEISEFRHYLNPVKNNQSLDLRIRMAVFELLHKFPDNSYARKPGGK